jgi:hypothetical protein
MAKDNQGMLIAAAIVVAAVLLMNQPPASTPVTGGDGGVDLCKLVSGSVSFTAQNMYLAGTAVTTEYVRVLKANGEGMKDLGQVSTKSGTMSVTPGGKYTLIFAENGTTYYDNVMDYTAPCQDAVDDKYGKLCTMDTDPTVTVFDEFGNVQSSSANPQAMTTDDSKDITIRVRVGADKCYGNPSKAGDNAICFLYNTSIFSKVKADTGSIGVPYGISSVYSSTGNDLACYKLPQLVDTAQIDIPVTIETIASADTNHNISI